VRLGAILATVGWAAAEILMRRSPASDRLARACSTAGLALAVAHVVLAFGLVYGWDHEAAIAGTAQQTAAVLGWGWRGGIFVNYLFLALWLADVCWWWADASAHRSRSPRAELVRLSLFTFMFVNAAIVFAPMPGRLVGIAAVTAVLFGSPVLRSMWRTSIFDRPRGSGVGLRNSEEDF
jgi:hypothetical protein